MRYIFLINSFGNYDVDELVEAISIACSELKINYRIELNSDENSTENILKKYKYSENIVFAVGGDGVINRALNGIALTSNKLGFIPVGTGNDFYKTVKETMDQGINITDIGKVNSKYFINIACFGIDADIANDDIIHNKYIPKSQRYNVSVLSHFLHYKAKHLEVYIGDEIYKGDFSTVVVCNGRYYGGGYKISPNSSLYDGLLDVYLIKDINRAKLAKLMLGMKNGSHLNSPYVTKISTDYLVIKSNKRISANVDGETLTSDVFNIESIHEGVETYYNEELIRKIKRR